MPKPVGVYPSSACFCHFQKQQEENKMSACLAKHAENIAICKSLMKLEQSERSERKCVGRNALQFYRKIVSIPIQP